MSKATTDSLTTGALLTALVVIFALASVYLPFASQLFLIMAAVPLSVLYAKFNFKITMLSAVSAVILVFLLSGLSGLLPTLLLAVPLGLVSGFMFHKRQKAAPTLLVSILTTSLGIVALLTVTMQLMGLSFQDFLDTIFPPYDELMKIYTDLGLLAAAEAQSVDLEAIKEMYNRGIAFSTRLLPAIILCVGAILSGIHYLVTVKILKRLHIKVRKFPRFDRWYLPAYYAYGLVIALILFTCRDFLPYKWLNILSSNLLAIYAIALFIVGLSVIAKWLNLRKQSRGMKFLWFFCLFLLLSSTFGLYILITVAIFGAFDMLMDFRHIHPNDPLLPKLKKNSKQP